MAAQDQPLKSVEHVNGVKPVSQFMNSGLGAMKTGGSNPVVPGVGASGKNPKGQK